MKKIIWILFGILLVSMLSFSCSRSKITEKEGWTLVWNDEFSGRKLDTTKWDYQIGTGSQYGLNGWGNEEAQYYTPENVFVKDGYLVIEAKKEEKEGKSYTSGRVRTMKQDGSPLFTTTYGRIEASMSLPEGNGVWPAFWMLSADESYGTWPLSGEIDIMESRGRLPNRVYNAIHYGQPWPMQKYTSSMYKFPAGQKTTGFHEYAVEWEPGVIRWFVDGNMYYETSSWWTMANDAVEPFEYPAPYDKPFYILLNLAIGGTYDEYRLPNDYDLPVQMKVDYVRVYEKSDGYNYDVKRPVPERDTKSIEKYRVENGNYIVDSNFSTATNEALSTNTMDKDSGNWYFLAISDFGGAAKGFAKDGTFNIDILEMGNEVHSVQLLQHLGIAKGYTYIIEFDAKADSNRTISVKLGGDDDNGWAVYSSQYSPALTAEYQTFKYRFTMENESDSQARLEFNVGKNDSSVSIKNVKVTVAQN